ncbi:MAG: tetratricopeptide repeat protein [Deltaproteobacteria bacterium]|nr:tetratricopeptide repeat protein [Deltaproteobacteria bacterium]
MTFYRKRYWWQLLGQLLGGVLLSMTASTGTVWADAAEEAYQEGARLAKAGVLKQALDEFDKAIRLKPTYAEAYSARGTIRNALVQNERAIQDFNEAIRLNPRYAMAYYNRANVYMDTGQFDKALKDYSEMLTLEPTNAEALYNRSLVHLLLAHGEAATDARAYLELKGWKDERALYVVLIGYVGYRHGKKDEEARKLLTEAKEKCNTSGWPYPILRYLQGELSGQALLDLAVDDDKKTEAQTYAGIDLALSGKPQEAAPRLVWVKDHGNKGFIEYILAATEFNRLPVPTTPSTP